ncbi:MAG: hypothetical protein LBP22_11625 [Deltaproteobacteria bacterium]|nr:hypothetical protein [Deltaproteobacteria bacterium]
MRTRIVLAVSFQGGPDMQSCCEVGSFSYGQLQAVDLVLGYFGSCLFDFR